MRTRYWLYGLGVLVAGVVGWQIWDSQQPIEKAIESRVAIGPLTIASPPGDAEPESLTVIDLTKAFVIIPPPENGTSEPPASIEVLPSPRPAMDEITPARDSKVVPASFEEHSAEPKKPMARRSAWSRFVTFMLGGSRFNVQPSIHIHGQRPEFFSPDFPLERELEALQADIERHRQLRFQVPQIHSGCPYQGGCPYDGSQYRAAKAAPTEETHDTSIQRAPAPRESHKQPKVDTMEVRPGDLPRNWFVRPF